MNRHRVQARDQTWDLFIRNLTKKKHDLLKEYINKYKRLLGDRYHYVVYCKFVTRLPYYIIQLNT